nr:type I restriction-modification enzyme R subunit C-terminal domain-containing protein [Pseudooceanicola pacificus]
MKHAEEKITSFRTFMEENKDEITALQILYNLPASRKRLTYAAIKELVQRMADGPHYLRTADVWQAFKRLDAARVKGAPVDRQLTEVVSLVRFALGTDGDLVPFGDRVEQRFNLWVGREKRAGRDYTAEQMDWLRMIATFIAANAEITPRDFMEVPGLADKGGLLKARALFGDGLNDMLDELQGALVA